MIYKPRQNSYDLLRIISAAAVVIIHINLEYFSAGGYIPAWFIHCALDTFTRFCVPCFFMISGAFILNNGENADFGYFYKKVFFKTVLPFLIFVIFYFVFDVSKALIIGKEMSRVFKPYIEGREYNLWFMYVITVIYALTPFLVRLRLRLSESTAVIGAVMWVIAAIVLTNITEPGGASYSPVPVFAYMSYFALGAVLHGKLSKVRRPSLLLIAAVLLFGVKYVLRILRAYGVIDSIPLNNEVYFFPTTVAGSAVVFLFFGAITIKRPKKNLAEQTFYIYLTHSFIMKALLDIISDRVFLNPPLTVLIMFPIVAGLSWLSAYLLLKIKKTIRKGKL